MCPVQSVTYLLGRAPKARQRPPIPQAACPRSRAPSSTGKGWCRRPIHRPISPFPATASSLSRTSRTTTVRMRPLPVLAPDPSFLTRMAISETSPVFTCKAGQFQAMAVRFRRRQVRLRRLKRSMSAASPARRRQRPKSPSRPTCNRQSHQAALPMWVPTTWPPVLSPHCLKKRCRYSIRWAAHEPSPTVFTVMRPPRQIPGTSQFRQTQHCLTPALIPTPCSITVPDRISTSCRSRCLKIRTG